MGDQRDQRPVAGEERRRDEGQVRILHPAVGEARRQQQQVVAPPAVGAVDLLGRGDHLRRVGELVGGAIGHRGLGVDAAARIESAQLEVAHRERHQVGGDRLRHAEVVDPVGALRLRVVGAHQGEEPGRHADGRLVGEAHPRRVLERDPGAGEDRLRLGVEQRQLAARGLRRLGPLEGGGAGGGGVVDGHPGGARRQVDRQRAAEDGDRLAELEGGLPRAVLAQGDLADLEVAGVEPEPVGAARVADLQPGAADQPVGREVDRQLELQVLDRGLVRAGERVRVPAGSGWSRGSRRDGRSDRRGARGGGRGRGGRGGLRGRRSAGGAGGEEDGAQEGAERSELSHRWHDLSRSRRAGLADPGAAPIIRTTGPARLRGGEPRGGPAGCGRAPRRLAGRGRRPRGG